MWHFMMHFMASDDSTFHSNVTWREINSVVPWQSGEIENTEMYALFQQKSKSYLS